MFKHLENKMCKELEALEEKYRTGMEMSEGDLRRIDLLSHALKCLAAYKEKKETEEFNGMSGNSYMNNSYMNNSGMNSYANSYGYGQNKMGRYTSRDMEMSGHYPPMYPDDRRW